MLVYYGMSNVAVMGGHWARVSEAQVNALRALDIPDVPEGRRFPGLLDRTCAIDVPTLALARTVNGREMGFCVVDQRTDHKHALLTFKAAELESEALRILSAEAWVRFVDDGTN